MTDDIVTRLRDYLAIVDHAFVLNELSDAADEIERLEADRDRWRSLANALTRDLAFRTDEKTANFIVEQMVARIEREEAVRGE